MLQDLAARLCIGMDWVITDYADVKMLHRVYIILVTNLQIRSVLLKADMILGPRLRCN